MGGGLKVIPESITKYSTHLQSPLLDPGVVGNVQFVGRLVILDHVEEGRRRGIIQRAAAHVDALVPHPLQDLLETLALRDRQHLVV